MTTWILNLIGIFGYFLGRYAKRRHKTKGNFKFWIADNWVELTQTLMLNVSLMLILTMESVHVDLTSFLQNYLHFQFSIGETVSEAAVAAAVGWFGTFIVYNLIKKKQKK